MKEEKLGLTMETMGRRHVQGNRHVKPQNGGGGQEMDLGPRGTEVGKQGKR